MGNAGNARGTLGTLDAVFLSEANSLRFNLCKILHTSYVVYLILSLSRI